MQDETGKTTPIKRTAVRETGVSRHHGAPLRGPPWNPSDHHSTTVLRSFRGRPQSCRETPASRTAAVSFCKTIHTEKYFRSIKQIKPKSDCIYHPPTDLEQETDSVRLVPNQSENSKYNLFSVWFNKIWKIFPCVYNVPHLGIIITQYPISGSDVFRVS